MLALALASLLAAAPDVSGTYRVETTKTLKVKKGETATGKVEVVPRADAHVSPDAPISLALSSGPSLKLAKEKLGRPDAKETQAKGVAFDVPFTAASAGKDEVKGTLTFFICTEKLCERQKREIAMAVEVQ
jgi:C-terminal processing protease CtpA/Prc